MPPIKRSASLGRLTLSLVIILAAGAAHADASRPGESGSGGEPLAFKLTPSFYATSDQRSATDTNLRANLGNHAVWLGYYQRGGEFKQTRSGYEYSADLPFGKLVPSLQIATHGFLGGSLNAEIGETAFGGVYALLGLGRTNKKDYYNLNFDPNDSAVYGLGTRLVSNSTINLYTVRDNRLHTEQRVNHLTWRYAPDPRHRLTADFSSKQGRPSAEQDSVSGRGLSLTYDFNNLFVRAAKDNKVNFSNQDMTRVSLGMRF
jgi:hypothetical protein